MRTTAGRSAGRGIGRPWNASTATLCYAVGLVTPESLLDAGLTLDHPAVVIRGAP
jgi:hypothetical protein